MSRFVWPHLFTLRAAGFSAALGTTTAVRTGNAVALRWATTDSLGFPREPFQVYRRPRQSSDATALPPLISKVAIATQSQTFIILPGGEPAYLVVATVTLAAASSALLEVLDVSGQAIPSQSVTLTASSVAEFRCPGIAALRISGSGSGSVGPVSAIGQSAFANLAGWTQIETVGLPLLNGEVGTHYRTNPQGVWPTPSQAPTLDGVTAAIRRFGIAASLQPPPPTTGIADFPLPAWPAPVAAAYVANIRGMTPFQVIDGVSNAVTKVTVGAGPLSAAGNPTTQTIYVANQGSNSVLVIDGGSNAVTATVTVGTNPVCVAVNPQTNKIYVANFQSNNVTVINGAGNSTIAVPAGIRPVAVAVNPVTNKIYVANQGSNTVTVIDGATNTATATVNLATAPTALAVNSVTNKTYVANYASGSVTVIDGATNATNTVSVGSNPISLAVNTATNKIYVASQGSGNLTVIDGASNSTSTLSAGGNPACVAVNPVTNKIYVADSSSNNLIVVDGATHAISTVNTGSAVLSAAVNPTANKIYVSGAASGNLVPMIEHCLQNSDDTNPASIQSLQTETVTVDGTRQAGVSASADVTNPTTVSLPVTGVAMMMVSTDSYAAVSLGYGTTDIPPDVVAPSLAISVLPVSATVLLGKSQQFTATVTGAANAAVTWSVNGIAGGNASLGTITPAGLFTAPPAFDSTAPLTIKVVSVQDSTKFATASVTISRALLPVATPITPPATAPASGGPSLSAALTSADAKVAVASAGGLVLVPPPAGDAAPAPVRPTVDNFGDYDFMVTAPFVFPFGLTQTFAALSTGQSPVESPAGVQSMLQQVHAPMQRDGRASAAIKVSWQPSAIPQAYAILASRAPNQSEVLNSARPAPVQGFNSFIGLAPVNPDPNTPPDQQIPSFTDTACALPLAAPDVNNRYLVAAQDVFGQWSNWVGTSTPLTAAPVTKLGLRNAEFIMDVTDAVGHVVPATLRIEFGWDWEDRAPGQIRFTGHFVPSPATTLGTSADLTGFALSNTGPLGTPAILTFTYTTPGPDTIDSASIVPVIGTGHTTNGAVQILYAGTLPVNPNQAIYSVEITGFSLDFSSTNEIDFLLFATGTEQIRPGIWSDPTEPSDPFDSSHPTRLSGKIVRAMDPVPPTVTFAPPPISWTALPDVTGAARGVLEWTADPKAAGYFVWEATESALMQVLAPNAPDPLAKSPPDTLAVRAAALQTLVNANQDLSLQGFARLTKDPIPENRTEIKLPASASILYVYRISAISGANVEAPRSPQIAVFGVPQLKVPPIPRLMLRSLPAGQTGIQIVALPVPSGVPASGYRVFRVRSAALSHEGSTMGPAKITESAAWTAYPTSMTGNLLSGSDLVAAQALGQVLQGKTVVDTTAVPSWYPYYYRIKAIGGQDPANGFYSGESDFSRVQPGYALPAKPPMQASISVSISTIWNAALVTIQTDLPAAAPSPVGPALVEVLLTPPAVKPAPLVTNTVLSSAPEAIPVGTLSLPPPPHAGSDHFSLPPAMRRSAPDVNGNWVLLILVPYTSAEKNLYQLRLTDPLARRSTMSF
jgi:YVTN family beta-propeller protein